MITEIKLILRLIANREDVTAPEMILLMKSSVPLIPTREHSEIENKVPHAAKLPVVEEEEKDQITTQEKSMK